MKDVKDKVVLVTGVSSGIGTEIAKQYIQNGAITYGIGRKDFELPGLEYRKVDIRKKADIEALIQEIYDKHTRLDIVISNAGMGISGPVETADTEDIKKIMDINFIGTVSVVQSVLPVMRKQGYGRIICTSSVASYVPLPFQAFYSASKSAMDTFVDATRSEVKAFGVEILCVHPGDVKTGFTSAREKNELPEDNPYKAICDRCVGHMERDEQGGMTAEYVAKKIYKISLKKRFKLRNVIGPKYKLFTVLLNILPRKIREWAVRKMYY